MSSSVLIELQALTGLMTDDIDYLVYRVLKGGTYFKKEESIVAIEEVESKLDWLEVCEVW